ncbi:MAG: hypothetical protein HY786_04180 [Deltaproteobacteria bacterium]|nr:hypothetical protein [Deltaproteobacteria bacterium]
MSQILVRGLEAETIERLKERAKRHKRSLQGEVKTIIEEAVPTRMSMDEAREAALQIRKSFATRIFSDSSELIREDRER